MGVAGYYQLIEQVGVSSNHIRSWALKFHLPKCQYPWERIPPDIRLVVLDNEHEYKLREDMVYHQQVADYYNLSLHNIVYGQEINIIICMWDCNMVDIEKLIEKQVAYLYIRDKDLVQFLGGKFTDELMPYTNVYVLRDWILERESEYPGVIEKLDILFQSKIDTNFLNDPKRKAQLRRSMQ